MDFVEPDLVASLLIVAAANLWIIGMGLTKLFRLFNAPNKLPFGGAKNKWVGICLKSVENCFNKNSF